MSASENLSAQWTLPYRRGAEFVALDFRIAVPRSARIAPYDFSEYRANWREAAAPSYVVLCRRDLSGDDVNLLAAYNDSAAPGTASLTIPASARAGDSYCLPLPSGPNVRLVSLAVSPQSGNAIAADLGVVALLAISPSWTSISRRQGNYRAPRDDVQRPALCRFRFRRRARSLGADMRAPRFPPRPHSPDPQTVALWHCDDPAGAALIDETIRLGAAGHLANPVGAVASVRGKFGSGL